MAHRWSQFAPRAQSHRYLVSRHIITLEGVRTGERRSRDGWLSGRPSRRVGVGLLWTLVWDYRYLYSTLILSYHFALRQVNRLPAYRKPSERSWDSLARPSGPTYDTQSVRLSSVLPSRVLSGENAQSIGVSPVFSFRLGPGEKCTTGDRRRE